MTQLEILELALIGAKASVRKAARDCCTISVENPLYGSLKSAIQDYDEINLLIENEKKSAGVPAATDTPDEEHHSCES